MNHEQVHGPPGKTNALISDAYASALRRAGLRLRELPVRFRRQSELEVQALLYSGALGCRWTTLEGVELTLIDPGIWNREPGPDFTGAAFELANGERLRGDIEVDGSAQDWDQHGHRDNPAFDRVVVHFFQKNSRVRFFTRNSQNRSLHQVVLDTAAPMENPDTFHLLRDPLTDRTEALNLIRQACLHRLGEKGRLLEAAARLHGKRGALFQSLAKGLGYKSNSVPMLLLAGRLGVGRAASPEGEALAFGLAGFLQAETFSRADTSSRKYLRDLWEQWWKLRHPEERMVLGDSAWRSGGNRPFNHPHRRVACLPLIAGKIDSLLSGLRRQDESAFRHTLESLTHPFWNAHYTLASCVLPTRAALIGSERAGDLAVNSYWPLVHLDPAGKTEGFFCLKAPAVAKKVREAADWLCPRLGPEELKLVWVQQGLLQLHHDFRGLLTPQGIKECLTHEG